MTLEFNANQLPPSKVHPGEDHNYCVLESPRKLKRKLADAIEKVESVQRKLKLSQQKVRRKKKQIMTMQQITMALKDKDLLSERCAETLEKYSGLPKLILERMSKGTQAGEYSDELSAFAMTLKFYSSKVHNFVRETFHCALPHPSQIHRWYSSIPDSAGFTSSSFAAFHQRVEEAKCKNKKVIVCLMLDEMAIRKHVQFDGTKFHGYILLS